MYERNAFMERDSGERDRLMGREIEADKEASN